MVNLRVPALLLCGVSAALSAKAPITHESVWLMKAVGAPLPSPDGKWLVIPVAEPAYDEKNASGDLWLAPAEGGAPRRITFTKGSESGVQWSPDSRRIAFSAKREGDEVTQIYVLDVLGGGEAQRVTHATLSAGSPKWRPDGKAILYASAVDPVADRKSRKYRARVYDAFPIRHWDRWLDETRPRFVVQELSEGAKPVDPLASSKLVADPGFGGALGNAGEDLAAVWTPDGKGIVFMATTKRNVGASAPSAPQLYVVPAAGGEPRRITNGEGNYARPVFRPDGKALYAGFEPEDGKAYHVTRLAMFAWPEPGERKLATAGFDGSVNSYAFTPDSREMYFTAETAGLEKIHKMPAGGGSATEVAGGTEGVYTGLSIPAKASGTLLFAAWESSTHPAEAVRVEPATGQRRFLTQFNTQRAAALDWQPLQHFTFTSKAGKPIHSMVALPPGFDAAKKYPLLVLMHGGPHSMWRDQFFVRWNYHLLAAPGYVVLLTNYTGSTGYGEKFAQAIQFDPFAGPGNEINEAADEAIRRFTYIDGSKQAAAGASYGGHMANWMQATTTRYKCLVSHAGLINLESQWGTSDEIYHREVNNGGPVWEQGKVWREQNPIRFAAKFRTPILVTVGERDFRVPLNQTLENWAVLQRLRIPSKLIVFEDANHWISKGEDSKFWYQKVQGWLGKYLR